MPQKRAILSVVAVAVIAGLCLSAVPAPAAPVTQARLQARKWNKMGLAARNAKLKLLYYSKAVAADPRWPVAWHNRGYAYWRLSQYPRAVYDLGRAVRLKPNYYQAWQLRGRCFSRMRMFDRAVAALSRAIRYNPRYDVAWHNRGYANYQAGRHRRAIRDLNRAIRLKPSAVTFRVRGYVYRAMGKKAMAKADFDRARAIIAARRGKPAVKKPKPKPKPAQALLVFETREASVKKGTDFTRSFAIVQDGKVAARSPWKQRTRLKTVSLSLKPGAYRIKVREFTRQGGAVRLADTPFNKTYKDRQFTVVLKPDQVVTMRILMYRNGEVINPPRFTRRRIKRKK